MVNTCIHNLKWLFCIATQDRSNQIHSESSLDCIIHVHEILLEEN